MKNLLLFILAATFLACNNNNDGPPKTPAEEMANAWKVIRIDSGYITYANGHRTNTGLYELKMIDQLTDSGHPPFTIVSGRECRECDANIALWAFSSADTNVTKNMLKISYPGTQTDYETNKTVFSSRLFLGNCFGNNRESAMCFQEEHVGDSTRKSIYAVRIMGNKLNDTLMTGWPYDIKTIFSRRCREIAGQDMTTEP